MYKDIYFKVSNVMVVRRAKKGFGQSPLQELEVNPRTNYNSVLTSVPYSDSLLSSALRPKG